MDELYNMIFKRKSVRRFDEKLSITESEMWGIELQLKKLIPLDESIGVRFKIVKREETTSKRGEYCVLAYSEKKDDYLLNVGYMLEQLDLYLASKDIGACWYALAKTDMLSYDGQDFVIMLAFGKSRPQDFREDIRKCKRKDVGIIWDGDFNTDVIHAVRYAPSACNTQPWRVVSDENRIQVYRNTRIKSFIPKRKLRFLNSIDMGIFLCFLEIALNHKGYTFRRMLGSTATSHEDYVSIATYMIEEN